MDKENFLNPSGFFDFFTFSGRSIKVFEKKLVFFLFLIKNFFIVLKKLNLKIILFFRRQNSRNKKFNPKKKSNRKKNQIFFGNKIEPISLILTISQKLDAKISFFLRKITFNYVRPLILLFEKHAKKLTDAESLLYDSNFNLYGKVSEIIGFIKKPFYLFFFNCGEDFFQVFNYYRKTIKLFSSNKKMGFFLKKNL